MSVRILTGDAVTMLATLEAESVQVVCTSPPYFALRDYGVDGQIGLEQTPAEFIARLVAVFDEIRRVLRADGTCWVNLGDSYAGSGKGPTGSNGIGDQEQRQGFTGKNAGFNERWGNSPGAKRQEQVRPIDQRGAVPGIPAKNLLLIPERFAIAMQDSGWYVRSRIAWCKKSAMPESVKDRPTSAWEHIWMFSKSRTYYYDAEAVRQPASPTAHAMKANGAAGRSIGPKTTDHGLGIKTNESFHAAISETLPDANLRNFWLLGPEPSSLNHYAAFVTEIPRRCILAGSRRGDTVLDPFLGSGTTAMVADRLQRDAIGIELSPEYAEMARQRLQRDAGPMFSDQIVVAS